MKQNLPDEIERTLELFDTGFSLSGVDLTEQVLRGIEREKKEQAGQTQRNATLTVVLLVLILLNIFAVKTAVKQTGTTQAVQITKTSGYSDLEAKDITIQINKKITGIADGKQ